MGFMASKIFCLHFYSMKTIDVPQVLCIVLIYSIYSIYSIVFVLQSAPMLQYVERKLFK